MFPLLRKQMFPETFQRLHLRPILYMSPICNNIYFTSGNDVECIPPLEKLC